MANRLWYKDEDPEYVAWVRAYLQELIDLYCLDTEKFKVPEDITLDHLKEFIEIILKHYQLYHIIPACIMDLGDAFDIFLYYAFRDEFPEDYPNYPQHDRRALALHVCTYFQRFTSYFIFPEDVPFILECLNAPEDHIELMYDKLDQYFEQFDRSKRFDELSKRWKVIHAQRLQAIEKHQPLPIRPMGIELDMCYNTK